MKKTTIAALAFFCLIAFNTTAQNTILPGDAFIQGSHYLEFGLGIPKEVSAGKIGYHTFSPTALDIVGAGTTGTNRMINFYAEGGSNFTGKISVGGAVFCNEWIRLNLMGTGLYNIPAASGIFFPARSLVQIFGPDGEAPASLIVPGNIGTNGLNPISGYPAGWEPGVHTKVVYAESGIGVGTGGNVNINLSAAGWATFSGPIATNGLNPYVGYPENFPGDLMGIHTKSIKVDVGIAIGGSNMKLAPGYRLFVETGILTEKVKVAISGTANWSDYVFDQKYQLPSLAEVEKFINANKHLPNIPSAEEVVKEGVNLGEMDAKLLAKIEELTLYIIEMNKKIAVLETKLEATEKK